ncbi:Nuclear envelope-associated protein 2-like protein [Drosera capensis]
MASSDSEPPTPTSSWKVMSKLGRKVDPLMEDLNEVRQRFRRNVVSMATELKDVRGHLALAEEAYIQESLTRQEAVEKANTMEKEIERLHRDLEERNEAIKALASAAEEYFKELDELKNQLTTTQATANATAASARSAHLQYLALLKELDEKNHYLKQHEDRVHRLAEQLNNLQDELQARESLQNQLRDEVTRVKNDMTEVVEKAGVIKGLELQKVCDEVSFKSFEKMIKLLAAKDEEITKLKDDIRVLSVDWRIKTKEMESQIEKHRRADHELKRRVIKLEFCLQETRSQTRKLLRAEERRDKTMKELKDELTAKQTALVESTEKQNFWGSPSFKILVSMSMLVLFIFTKR